jgi:Ca2+/H+ antiporter
MQPASYVSVAAVLLYDTYIVLVCPSIRKNKRRSNVLDPLSIFFFTVIVLIYDVGCVMQF